MRHPEVAPTSVLVIEPLLVGSEAAGRLCGVSGRTWRRLASEGAVPEPIRLGRRRVWIVSELTAWAAARCPSAERWEMQNDEKLPPVDSSRSSYRHDNGIAQRAARQR